MFNIQIKTDMSKIENSKTYLGKELENIFFRPGFSGDGAEKLGIRVLYNMPVPTRIHFWHRSEDVLHKYAAAGWVGSPQTERYTKTIDLHRVKAEMSYSADEYFSLVYDSLAQSAITQLDDLTGTELEVAETAIFREAVVESVRATMWLGKTARETGLNTFDGLLYRIMSDIESQEIAAETFAAVSPETVQGTLQSVWNMAPLALRQLYAEGQLAYFVTGDIYEAYMDCLDQTDNEAAYLARQSGHNGLMYKGIPLVNMQIDSYLGTYGDIVSSVILLTDRRNLALALNTGDFPGSEVRMWYNPDLMENRQRAIFMAGCDYLLPELISFSFKE